MLPAALTLAFALAEPPLTLEWQAPAGCPDAARVRALTLDLLRRRSPDAAPPPVSVRVVVTRDGDRWRAALALRSPLGDVDRTLTAAECPLLARAAALVAAVHLDPTAVSRTLAPLLDPPTPPTLPPVDPNPGAVPADLSPGTAAAPPDLSPETAIPPADLSPGTAIPPADLSPETAAAETAPLPPDLSPETADPLVLAPAPRPAPVPRAHLRLEGGLDGGLLPGLGGDLSLVGGGGGRLWRVEAGLVAVPLRRRAVGDTGARFDRLAGLARACAIWRIPPRREQVALHGCLGGEFGGLHAVATGVDQPNPRWTPWAAALVGGGARVPVVGPLGLWVGVEAVLALVRPEFTAGGETLYRLSPAGVRANLGVDLQFVARKRGPRATE